MHDPAATCLGILVNHGRYIRPDVSTGSGRDLEIEIRNRPVMGGAITHLALFCTHACPQRAAPPEQFKAGLAAHLVASEPEERLGAGVP